jgi:hypothetical protein
MIKRLIDEQELDSADRRLAELLRAGAPFARDPFRKRRIWVRLERLLNRPTSARFGIRPVAIVTFLASGTAAAAIGQRFVSNDSGFLDSGTVASAALTQPVLNWRSASAALKDKAPSEAKDAPKPEASAQPESSSAANAAKRPVRAPSRSESSEDPTNLVEAIQALRRERDPARAQMLLNGYLKANPRGSHSGDALALSIEAASSQRDPRAAEYARRYLVGYPKGKYRDLATRALEAQR